VHQWKMVTRQSVEILWSTNCRRELASLLEVGTGFHSELTGRENIFLSGAILGMSKAEIRRKFDEIVAFSESRNSSKHRQHYSTGMYLRLAFSVAVHHEPEVLFVDEVLAIGDARFFAKCINKMRSLHSRGMTTTLVSHHMFLIHPLCTRAICMSHGGVLRWVLLLYVLQRPHSGSALRPDHVRAPDFRIDAAFWALPHFWGTAENG
jgi:lipopolysaccharide transport system ATP-binding protein